MKPLILLTGGTGAAANGTPTWALNQNYAENIRRAGGIPILAVNNDCAEEYADLADGLLLSGGKDVEPKLYGQEKMFDFVITDPQRDDLEYKIIAKPLIPKLRRSYTLPDGSVLEVNHVDEGQPTEFWYAEVEYPTVESALAWQPESCGLGDYLKDEVTNQPGQSMGEYWVETRG